MASHRKPGHQKETIGAMSNWKCGLCGESCGSREARMDHMVNLHADVVDAVSNAMSPAPNADQEPVLIVVSPVQSIADRVAQAMAEFNAPWQGRTPLNWPDKIEEWKAQGGSLDLGIS